MNNNDSDKIKGSITAISRRSFLVGMAALASSVMVSGCSGESSSDGETIQVIDSVGRAVEVPHNPSRIAGLDSFTGELMVLIGAGEKLVGTPSGVVSDVLLQEIYPDLVNVPAPMSSGAVNIEELMSEDPDVVLIKQEVYTAADQKEKLDSTGIPYVVIGYTSMEEQIEAMKIIGQTCGDAELEKATRLAQYYEDVIADCQQRVADLPEDKKVRVYHAINALTMTDGYDSLGGDWIDQVGAINVSASEKDLATTSDYTVSLEQIYNWDPEVIVCNSAETTEYLLTKSNCAGLSAVKNKRVYTIPVGATRWGQRGSVETYLAMLWLGCIIYPEQYSDVDLKQEVVDYYRDYIGLDIDDETYELMLSGEGIRQASTKAGQ